MKWRIYYDNGHETQIEDPAEVESRGVVCIIQPDPDHGRMIISKFDFYCWHTDTEQWFGHDQFGLWDCLARPGFNRILFGRTIPTAKFHAILRKAEDDPDFPPRSASTPREAAVWAM